MHSGNLIKNKLTKPSEGRTLVEYLLTLLLSEKIDTYLLEYIVMLTFGYHKRIISTTLFMQYRRIGRENMLQIYRRTPIPRCDFNKVPLQFSFLGISSVTLVLIRSSDYGLILEL